MRGAGGVVNPKGDWSGRSEENAVTAARFGPKPRTGCRFGPGAAGNSLEEKPDNRSNLDMSPRVGPPRAAHRALDLARVADQPGSGGGLPGTVPPSFS